MMHKEKISRKLTPGERLLTLEVYKTSVNADLVRVHNQKFVFFQQNYTLMTPEGSIYAADAYRDDYSTSNLDDMSFFIHEMAHVWQKQNHVLNPLWAGIGEFIRNAFIYKNAYKYRLDQTKDLLDYRVEQQAQIIQDYFRVFHQKIGPWGKYIQNVVSVEERNGLYQKVLTRFIANPKYPGFPSFKHPPAPDPER